MEEFGALWVIIFFVAFLFIVRLFGAWMLRIDEVIDELKKITSLLKKIEKKDSEVEN